MGPALATECATDGLVWAQHLPQCMRTMVLYGPCPGHQACYRWSCVGPSLTPMHATDGLAWAQCCPPQHATDDLAWAHPWSPSMLLMVLCWPGTSPKACYRWYCMGPSLAPTHATDGLAWAQC